MRDMRGQFKKGKDDNVWYLIIFGDVDILRKFENIWKSIRAIQMIMCSMIKITWK